MDAEVLFKVGDSGGHADGDIISVKPPGWLIPSDAMTAWIEDGVEPDILAEMPQYLQRRWRHRIRRLRWVLSHTAAEVAKELGLGDEEMGAEEKRLAAHDADGLKAEGADTSWGRLDLRHHAAVRVSGLTLHDVKELLDPYRDTDHIGRFRAKRRHGFKYRDVLPAEAVSRITDETQRVDVDRKRPIDRETLFGALRDKAADES